MEHVRCVVFGQRGDREFADVLGFLRGFSALYGSGLELQSEPRSSAQELDALVNSVLMQGGGVLMHVNARRSTSSSSATSLPQQVPQEELGELFARITVQRREQEDTAGRTAVLRAQEYIVFGKDALTHWMKSNLLESRYSLEALAANAALKNNGALQVDAAAPVRLFVSGDRAQVGKSTVCLGLVGALLRGGYAASELAYIKPATQCEKPQLIAKFCRQQGITCCDIGPILFYKGFTREFLKGNTETSAQLLARAKAKVDEVGRGKKVVVVDGVGYPAVGSICGVSNASVAKAVQAPVVLVGKKGVGDAVDSFNLNATFFESHGVKVLGGIFNRLPPDGFYSLENCRESVTAYFDKFQLDKRVYGFLPELVIEEDPGAAKKDTSATNCDVDMPESGVFLTEAENKLATQVIDAFQAAVDMAHLLSDAGEYQAVKSAPETAEAVAVPAGGKSKRPRRKVDLPTSTEVRSL